MIALITSPAGRWLAGIAAVLALLAAVYLQGRSDGAAVCEAQVQAAIVAEQDRQARIANRALEEARARAEARDTAIVELQKQVDAYDGAKSCLLDPADADRLRRIR